MERLTTGDSVSSSYVQMPYNYVKPLSATDYNYYIHCTLTRKPHMYAEHLNKESG